MKFCNKLSQEHAVTAVWHSLKITLDNAPSKGTWASSALSRRWEQVAFESLPKKIGLKSRTHFSVIWHLKSSKIWTNYQRTKVWLTENHTHTYVEGQNSHWEICCSVSFPSSRFATRQILQHSPHSARLLGSAGSFGTGSHDSTFLTRITSLLHTCLLTVCGITLKLHQVVAPKLGIWCRFSDDHSQRMALFPEHLVIRPYASQIQTYTF